MLSNIELWNAVRKHNPTFAEHTSEGTKELFTERGFQSITQSGMGVLNEFWNLAMPYYLQLVNISHAKDPLEDNGFGEAFEIPYGEYVQRLSVNSIKPISPVFRDLQNGDSPDPFVVRKPSANQRFFTKNFDYQSLITMPDEWEQKRIFISEFGMSEFLAGVFQGLENGYIIQKFTNKLEVLNAMINSTEHPLKDSQKISISLSDKPTETELVDMQRAIMNTVEIMTTSAQTGGYNAEGFASTQDKDRLYLLVRPGYRANLALDVVRGSYNADTLNLGINIITVPHFGGLEPYADAEYNTPLYPVYSKLGEQIGYNTTENANTVTVENSAVFWKDPNEDVIAVLADKGVLVQFIQNPYRVEPIRNPRGLYTNYWASAPNNSIVGDPLYNMVTITNNAKASTQASTAKSK